MTKPFARSTTCAASHCDGHTTLHAALARTLVALLLFVTATAAIGHELARRARIDEALVRETHAVGEMLAHQVETSSAKNDSLHLAEWTRQVTRHPDVLLTAVLQSDGGVVAAHPNQFAWIRLALTRLPRVPATVRLAWPPLESAGPDNQSAFATRLQLGDKRGDRDPWHLLLVQRDHALDEGFVFSWWFHLPLVVATLAGGYAAWQRLRRLILEPLHRLCQLTRRIARPNAALSRPGPFDHRDEFGRLATSLRALDEDRAQQQERLRALQRDFNYQLEVKTRKMSRALDRATQQAGYDALTGLYNRRALNEKLPALFDVHIRSGNDLAVVALDLDNFKMLNDSLGHAAGDEFLTFVGRLLRCGVRHQDLVFRTGGDEFLIACPDTTSQQAAAMMQRLFPLFRQRADVIQVRPAPSLSAGVASLRDHRPRDVWEFVRMADEALYVSKRNRKGSLAVCSASV